MLNKDLENKKYINQEFKRTIIWNKYRFELTTETKKQ